MIIWTNYNNYDKINKLKYKNPYKFKIENKNRFYAIIIL